MSSKRKDSHPTKSAATQEEEEGEEEESQQQQQQQEEEEGGWNGFSVGKNNNGLQLLLQNGNGPPSPNRFEQGREDLIADDTSSTGNKDDDDDDDDDDGADDKFDNAGDPERLKAFNMFVRLFVDENLDRHVPISKQPKEKIQAIIDSCTRQFPEYSERARKRIRTYLKSCRRTKRSREQAGLDTNNRPSLPHLTSVHAEQLLARACENEAENAKRMRLGMEPISQPPPAPLTYAGPLDTLAGAPLTFTQALDKPKMEYKPEQLATLLAAGHHTAVSSMSPVSTSSLVPASTLMYRQQAMQQNQSHLFTGHMPGNGHLSTGVGGGGTVMTTTVSNGLQQPTDKKPPLLNHKLNGTEMAAVRQLITGYRESAAFLLRSADELEHLLQIQPKL